MPLPTLAATITSAGISAPSYAQILQSLQESVQGIYGSDVYIAADSQDGQFLALLASAINDSNQMAIATYNAYSPTFAQGVGLSSQVKINGIRRQSASNSTAVGDVVGVAGTTIENGVVADENRNLWDLPTSVTIPPAGMISITVTAQEAGAIVAPTGSINKINTPTFGWQSFVSTSDATTGAPVETDATLRQRQSTASALPSTTPLAGMLSALANLEGVIRVSVYENDTASPDVNGIPARNISVVIQGGDVLEIATIIGQKKTPGASTYGDVSENYTDPNTGIVYTINFYVLDEQAVSVEIEVEAGPSWNDQVEAEIQNTVSAYINALDIGQDVVYSRLWRPAYINGVPDGEAYEINILTLNGALINVPIAFNKKATCDPSNVVITVAP